jgi:hypothetical protein
MRRKEKTSPWMGMMMEKEKKDKWGGEGGVTKKVCRSDPK